MSTKGCLAALSLAFATNAAADTEFFVQARAGIANLDHFRLDDDEHAGQLLAGARWGHFGVEAGYLETQRFEDTFVSRTLSNFSIAYANDIDGIFLGLNARCPLGDGPWYVAGRAGAVHWSMDYDFVPSRGPVNLTHADVEDTDLYAGAGIGRDFGEHVSLGVALDYFRLDGEDDEVVYVDASLRAWSLALEYRF